MLKCRAQQWTKPGQAVKLAAQVVAPCVATFDYLLYLKALGQVVAVIVGSKAVVLVANYLLLDAHKATGLAANDFGAFHGAEDKVRNVKLLVFKRFSFC